MNIKIIQAERILSPTQISIADYCINPYRGCPFACSYCYAQENKSIKKRNELWGSFIDIKINAAALLEKEIKNKTIRRVLLGSTVECYPPQEKEFRLTSAIIKQLNKHGIAATILTKSLLIHRDLALISKFKENKIYLTINFESEQTKTLFEPFSPSIENRIKLLQQIKSHRIDNRVHIAPLIPYVQDVEKICAMIGDLPHEIAVELYNRKMGNWETVKAILKKIVSQEKLQEINETLTNKERHQTYGVYLERTIKNVSKKIGKKILLLAPHFDDYYRAGVRYE